MVSLHRRIRKTVSILLFPVFLAGAESLRVGAGSRLAKPKRSVDWSAATAAAGIPGLPRS